jgi:hypothetical protein
MISVCLNDCCIAKHKVFSRYYVSALAIELAGLAQALFGITFPALIQNQQHTKSTNL